MVVVMVVLVGGNYNGLIMIKWASFTTWVFICHKWAYMSLHKQS